MFLPSYYTFPIPSWKILEPLTPTYKHIWSPPLPSHPGVLQADPGVVRDQNTIFRLFCHECQRIFHDRLINNEDKTYFNEMLAEMAGKHFSQQLEGEFFTKTPIIFGDFMKMGADAADRFYEDIVNLEKLQAVLQDVRLLCENIISLFVVFYLICKNNCK